MDLGEGAAGREALAQVSADVSYREMAQVLKGTAGLESGNVCLDLIYKYFLCYKTSFNSSCLQFSQVDASTVCYYMILFADCDSLGLSLHTCKVGLTAPILIVYWWKKKSETNLSSSQRPNLRAPHIHSFLLNQYSLISNFVFIILNLPEFLQEEGLQCWCPSGWRNLNLPPERTHRKYSLRALELRVGAIVLSFKAFPSS